MKHLIATVALTFLVLGHARADIVCSPTTPVAQQSRTQMKHRNPGLHNVSLKQTTVEDMLNWPNPARIDRNSGSAIDPREN